MNVVHIFMCLSLLSVVQCNTFGDINEKIKKIKAENAKKQQKNGNSDRSDTFLISSGYDDDLNDFNHGFGKSYIDILYMNPFSLQYCQLDDEDLEIGSGVDAFPMASTKKDKNGIPKKNRNSDEKRCHGEGTSIEKGRKDEDLETWKEETKDGQGSPEAQSTLGK